MKRVLHFTKRFLLFFWNRACQLLFSKKKSITTLKKFKNAHSGDRCFIVATGPSLTNDDLKKIENEYSISVNSIVNMLSKTTFLPTYYMIQDKNVFKKVLSQINASNLKTVFFGLGDSHGAKVNLTKKDAKKLKKHPEFFNLNTSYHYYEIAYKQKKAKFTFTDDFSKECFDGCTVAYSAIQLAVFMGFSRIYLLGCDCTFGGHFDEKSDLSTIAKPIYFEAYKKAKEYADFHNIKIINCTRGGMLEVFERQSLEEVLDEKRTHC